MEKVNLYIDFDGVIVDSITILYKLFKQEGIDRNDRKAVLQYLRKLDWEQLIKTSNPINNSIEWLNIIMKSALFRPAILTHITCQYEAEVKKQYIRERVPALPVYTVPKANAKSIIGCVKNAVLVDDYTPNLKEWESKGGIGIKFMQTKKEGYLYQQISSLGELFETEVKELVLKR